MSTASDFLALHVPGRPLLMPNAWDAGSARLFAGQGFNALATTSSGFAATLGRGDGSVTREQALTHARTLVQVVDVPVSADLENGFGDSPDAVAECVHLAVDAGLAGCSIEDWDGAAIYDRAVAVERIAAAVGAADGRLVITARAENHIHSRDDLEDTIGRLRAFAAAGADVVFAPGITTAAQIDTVVSAVDVPVSVLLLRGVPPVNELAGLGVARVSVGGGFAFAAYGAAAAYGQELQQRGTFSGWDVAASVRGSFG